MVPEDEVIGNVDRSHLSVAGPRDPSDEPAFWHSKTPAERLRALEYMRRSVYGIARACEPLQKVLEVRELNQTDR
jgi:hypothetical protein